ncbi:MAG: [NiFe]-hydrogenase assembly chaperone HybE [Gammaproteobacteria bacterium]|nr:[NiFe]-hydrogenase assembly chaperone HybE [Gammaproteobacteria bacterium]
MLEHPDPRCAALEACFNHILRTRMQGLPILNPALQVQAVGFRDWDNYRFGVLVTPWFMSLMLLPQVEATNELTVGSKRTFVFPSGRYAFIAGMEEPIGRYFSCSLISPVFELDSQQQAVEVAVESLNLVMDQDCQDESGWSEAELLETHWQDLLPVEEAGDEQLRPSRLRQSVSRRDLLRGQLLSAGEKVPG